MLFMGKSTISMASFNSFLYVYQRLLGVPSHCHSWGRSHDQCFAQKRKRGRLPRCWDYVMVFSILFKFVRNTLYTIKCVFQFFVGRNTLICEVLSDHPLEFAATTAEPVRLHSLRVFSRTSRGILKFWNAVSWAWVNHCKGDCVFNPNAIVTIPA